MSITRLNKFESINDKSDELTNYFKTIVQYIKSSEGNISCELLVNSGNKNKIVIIEVWESVEAHKNSFINFPKDEMMQAMKLLAEPPDGNYYNSII